MDHVSDILNHRPDVPSESDRKQDKKESLHRHPECAPEYWDGQRDGSRQSLENHGKLDEIRRFSNKKFGEGHDVGGRKRIRRGGRKRLHEF